MSKSRLQIFEAGRLAHDTVDQPLTIGRGRANRVRIDEPTVSSRHAEIVAIDGAFLFRDLRSLNGSAVRRHGETLVVAEPIGWAIRLEDGDELLLGHADQPVRLSIRIQPVPDAPLAAQVSDAGSVTFRFDQLGDLARRIEFDPVALLCLYRLMIGLGSANERAHIFSLFASLAFEFVGAASHVTIHTRSRDDAERFDVDWTRAREGEGEEAGRLALPWIRHILLKHEALLVADSDPGGSTRRSSLLVPLWDQHEVRGIVQLENRRPAGTFGPRDLELLTLMANQSALVLSNLEMTASLRRLNDELRGAVEKIDLLAKAKEHLQKFVPETVKRLVDERPEHPHLTNFDVDATVLFLDIGGYTKLTEALERDRVVLLVETYFSAFIDDIYDNGGDINETAGDGLMIIFRSDDRQEHCRNAVRAALAVRAKTLAINQTPLGFDPIDVNIGINTGFVKIGARKLQGLGGSRWTYTATGLVTNVAARLGAHATKGQILIGPETADRVVSLFDLRPLGPIAYKNVSQPMPTFEVLAERDGKGQTLRAEDRFDVEKTRPGV